MVIQSGFILKPLRKTHKKGIKMLIDKLRKYLDSKSIQYSVGHHPVAFTAQESAELAHISGKDFAKTVMVRIGGRLSMLVLPAKYQVDFLRLARALGTGDTYLVSEEEFSDEFPDCDIGAMPPFGNLYGMPVYLASSLARNEQITFIAGTHTDTITMDYQDFEFLVKPKVIRFTDRRRRTKRPSLVHI